NALALGFMAPRYFLDEIGILAFLWLVGGAYRKLRPAGSLWWLDVINLLLITVALADLRLTQIMHVRLDWDVVSLAAGETPKMMWRMSRPYLPSLLLGVTIVTIFYALALGFLQRLRKSASEQATPAPDGRSFAFAAVACVLLGSAGVIFATG